jgi:flagellin-like hook-associated protein FlgL
MAVTGIGFGGALLNQSVSALKTQLAELQTQLATGKKSTTYSGMGLNEGFAIAARTQLGNISSYATTMTNVTTNISVTNTALDSYRKIASAVQTATGSGVQAVNGTGQTAGQQTAVGQFASMIGILNTQAGNRYVFSGSAIDTAPVASADSIMNGTASQAGLKQMIAERKQADVGTGLGRLVITAPTATSVQLAEDFAGSPYGFKLSTISTSFTGATVAGPTGTPPAVSVDLGVSNPNSGEVVKFGFTLPDGSTESITLTASSATPLPANSFAIGATPAATAANLNTALNTAVGKLANTALVAASAMQASDDFFNWSSMATGVAVNNQASTPVPISGTTALSGTTGTDSLGSGFAPGDTLTVNGKTITFVASGATGNQLNVTDNVQTLLAKIDSLSGTSKPSTVANGAVMLRGGTTSALTVSSSNTAAFAALGFSAPVNAQLGPLRVSGSPPLTGATAQRAGTAADTVIWYNGESGSTPARATAVARVDDQVTVNYGARANESAIRSALQAVAVMAAFTTSPTSSYAADQISSLNVRVTDDLSPPIGAQTIADIQSDLANAGVTMRDAQTRQNQAKLQLQNMVEDTESVSADEVATKLLALQTSLQASYQTTSMLSQLSLVKYL